MPATTRGMAFYIDLAKYGPIYEIGPFSPRGITVDGKREIHASNGLRIVVTPLKWRI